LNRKAKYLREDCGLALAYLWVVEAEQQLYDGALPAAAAAYQRHGLPRLSRRHAIGTGQQPELNSNRKRQRARRVTCVREKANVMEIKAETETV
jgi:hypothetical protein